MDFKITSENIEHPLLKPVLEELIPVFKQRGIRFYLIGAVARDIILDLSKEKSQRLTMDLYISKEQIFISKSNKKINFE